MDRDGGEGETARGNQPHVQFRTITIQLTAAQRAVA
jgi:hypothetical protein